MENKNALTFDQWRGEVDEHMRKLMDLKIDGGYTEFTGADEYWQGVYNRGTSVDDAVHDEVSSWEPC